MLQSKKHGNLLFGKENVTLLEPLLNELLA